MSPFGCPIPASCMAYALVLSSRFPRGRRRMTGTSTTCATPRTSGVVVGRESSTRWWSRRVRQSNHQRYEVCSRHHEPEPSRDARKVRINTMDFVNPEIACFFLTYLSFNSAVKCSFLSPLCPAAPCKASTCHCSSSPGQLSMFLHPPAAGVGGRASVFAYSLVLGAITTSPAW